MLYQTDKMPKNEKMSRGFKASKQERERKIALSDDTATYGRVIKMLGNRQCRVIVPDASSRLIEVRATWPKKRATINVDDIVVVAMSGTAYEITVTMDQKTAHKLSKEKKLHPQLLLTGEQMAAKDDAGIEFDYDGLPVVEEEHQEDDESEEKKGNDDINIDDI